VFAWLAAFAGLGLIGVLREAQVIPSSGDPLVDVLVAFLPFVACGLCVFDGIRVAAAARQTNS
jgi:Na+-translocating ferredoxin:NAD+ oxidoreductase RNF subunit RnfB